ncbi:MAG: tRNA pseudouridine(55) synthase TruB [Planctomycetota bacterium]
MTRHAQHDQPDRRASPQADATPAVDGIVNVRKPVGASSAKYVYRLRPIFGTRKVGHAGTLDPFASGVLIGCLGRATKLVELLMGLPKSYRTTLHLGVTNATFDTEMPFEPVPAAAPIDRKAIEQAVARFVGAIPQIPPAFSAVKIHGVSSHRLAREGRAVPREPRTVRIDRIEILGYAWPRLELDIRCGRGTYIRAIARDLGKQLGCGACCESLTRTAVGPFDLQAAVSLDGTCDEAVRSALVPLEDARKLLAAAE